MTAVTRFADTLRSLPGKKTPDDFWPIGLYQSRHALAISFALLTESAGTHAMYRSALPYTPSALLNLHYCLCLGARTTSCSTPVPTDLNERILQDLQSHRADPSFELRRANRLRSVTDDFLAALTQAAPVPISEARLIGGLTLAVAEAAAFNCYRLVTELHGPYVTRAGIAVVRSIDVAALQRLVRAPRDGLRYCHLTTFFPVATSLTSIQFDFFGHPLFSSSPATHATLLAEHDGAGVRPVRTTTIAGQLSAWLDGRAKAVEVMTDEERALELARIVCHIGAFALGHGEEAEALASRLPHHTAMSCRWAWPRSALVAAMDLGKELTGENCIPWYS